MIFTEQQSVTIQGEVVSRKSLFLLYQQKFNTKIEYSLQFQPPKHFLYILPKILRDVIELNFDGETNMAAVKNRIVSSQN